MRRREAVGAIAAAALTAAFRWTPEEARKAAQWAREAVAAQTPYQAQFFTSHE